MLEAGRIQKVPPPQTTQCVFCGSPWEGLEPIAGQPVREFVAYDTGGGGEDEVPLIDTMDDRACGPTRPATRSPATRRP